MNDGDRYEVCCCCGIEGLVRNMHDCAGGILLCCSCYLEMEQDAPAQQTCLHGHSLEDKVSG